MPKPEPSLRTLSAIELECLRWTAEGKTAWEVGRIVFRSERAVAGYLCSAMRKLDCTNKYHLVAKVVRMGWVD